MEKNNIKPLPNNFKTQLFAWLLAIRPPTLLIPTIQIVTASSLAFKLKGTIDWQIALSAWLVAVLITVGTNLINDACDDEKGLDKNSAHSKRKVIALGYLTRAQVFKGGLLAFAMACLIPWTLPSYAFTCFLIVLFCSLIGYCYTAGPYPISYLGLSELFILIFYGGVCVGVPYYAMTHVITPGIIIASLQMGLLAILPNALNNLRDIDEDRLANKKTLAVRFGIAFARYEIVAIVVSAFALNLSWFFLGSIKQGILPYFLLPLAYIFLKGICGEIKEDKILRYFLLSVSIHFLFGLMLSL